MEVRFSGFIPAIQSALSGACRDIRVAVCWFTHRDLFDVLLAKLAAGVRVEVVLEFDAMNFKPEGLPWPEFIRRGGMLRPNRQPVLMHDKFALIDGMTLLAGSVNWTYGRNHEHLFQTDQPDLVAAFSRAWDRLAATTPPIQTIEWSGLKARSWFPLFDDVQVEKTALRKRVAQGANLWVLRLPRREKNDSEDFFREGRIGCDSEGLLQNYWHRHPLWRKEDYLSWAKERQNAVSGSTFRRVHRWLLRLRQNDLVLLRRHAANDFLLGVVRSEPLRSTAGPWSTHREVQWITAVSADRIPVSGGPPGLARYPGSAMALLAVAFGDELAVTSRPNQTIPGKNPVV